MEVLTPALQLAAAVAWAADTHKAQLDKGGAPYILHPIRVMQRLRTDDYELMAIAVMHDAIEDSDMVRFGREVIITNLMMMGFSHRVIEGILALTHIPTSENIKNMGKDGEYLHYIRSQIAPNPDARLVKMEDLRDNTCVTRLKGLREKDFARIKKYHEAYVILKEWK